jgi:O-succinylbenzoic acid--CoA ligase
MERKGIDINGIKYDAPHVLKELISNPPTWKAKGLEFMIQLLDPSETPVKFHTSGTTGTPKEMTFSKKQVFYSAENSSRFFGLDASSQFFLCLPADFVAGRLMMARAFISNAHLVWVEPSLNPLKDIEHAISFAAFTPAQVATIIVDVKTRERFNRIEKIIIGGGEIGHSLENELIDFNSQVFATYGMTETLTHVAVRRIGEQVYQSVYKELVFSTNEDGCLVIDLPFISPEKIITKDIVELIDSQSFIWKGRLDHVINSGGIKLHAEEMEKKLIRAGLLQEDEFYITSKPDPVFGSIPVMILLDKRKVSDIPAFLELMNHSLGKYEAMKHLVFTDHFEYTETGKLKRLRF